MPQYYRRNRRHSPDSGLTIIFLVLLATALWRHKGLFVYALYFLAFLFAMILLFVMLRSSIGFKFYRRPKEVKEVDSMEGLVFEKYVAEILRRLGYENISLTERYDAGVDIVAEKNGVRWGIQVKRNKNIVKADAVRQVVTALKLYNCQRAMVITNSSFSEVAQRLAKSNQCVLIGRSELTHLIGEVS